MNKRKVCLLLACLLLAFISFTEINAQKTEKLKISGTIIGFDLVSRLISLYEPFDSPAERVIFIVRVDEISKGKETSPYLLVHYRHWYYDKIQLSDDVLDGKKQWKLKLDKKSREKKCDGKLRNIMYMNAQTTEGKKLTEQPRLIRTSAGEKED